MQISGFYALVAALFLIALAGFGVFAVNLAHFADSSPKSGNVTLMVLGILVAAAFMLAALLAVGSQKLKRQSALQKPVVIEFTSRKDEETGKTSKELKISGYNFTLTLQTFTSLAGLFIFLTELPVDGVQWVGWVALAAFFVFLAVGLYGIIRIGADGRKQLAEPAD